jgi:hypothetical protein
MNYILPQWRLLLGRLCSPTGDPLHVPHHPS